MTILGIDPGTAILGYGIVKTENNRYICLEYGTIENSSSVPPGERLLKIYNELKKIIKKHKPDEIALENLFFNKNSKTVISIGEARGVVMLAAEEQGIKLANYTPLQVKMAVTAYGKSSKKDVQIMVQRILGLKEMPKPDDAADGLAIAICHSHYKINNKTIDKH